MSYSDYCCSSSPAVSRKPSECSNRQVEVIYNLLQMFQDYTLQQPFQLGFQIDTLCLADNGILLASSYNSLYVSHIYECINPIQLIDHLKEELKLTGRLNCDGITTIAMKQTEADRCCFGLTLGDKFCVVVVGIVSARGEPIELQLKGLKLVNLREQQHLHSLRLVQGQANTAIIEERIRQDVMNEELNLIDVLSYEYPTGNLVYNKFKKVRLGRANQEETDSLRNIWRANARYQVFQGKSQRKLLLYHQLPSHQRHHMFVYGLASTTDQTFPENCLSLPAQDTQGLLINVLVVPNAENSTLEQHNLFLFYQLHEHLQIIYTQFSTPHIVLKKYTYEHVSVVDFVGTSLNSEEIYLKGIQNCINNLTVLLLTNQNLLAAGTSLTLLTLPCATASNKVNIRDLPRQVRYLRQGIHGFWVYSSSAVIRVSALKKGYIYEEMLKRMSQGASQIMSIASQVVQLLE